jgi:hypothetical protein
VIPFSVKQFNFIPVNTIQFGIFFFDVISFDFIDPLLLAVLPSYFCSKPQPQVKKSKRKTKKKEKIAVNFIGKSLEQNADKYRLCNSGKTQKPKNEIFYLHNVFFFLRIRD